MHFSENDFTDLETYAGDAFWSKRCPMRNRSILVDWRAPLGGSALFVFGDVIRRFLGGHIVTF